jgi:3-oxoacyl-[acyl-carrier protein] reductase
MLTSIKDRAVVVTGASKGIGKGIARVFAAQGARVMVVARNADQAAATAAELGNGAASFAADVTDFRSLQAMARATADAFGGIDIVCANAGIFPQVKIEDMDPDDWDQVLGTNLKGTFLSVKACLTYLKKSDQGRVVLTSSITGPITGFPGWAHYGASKSGQLGFMRTACIELSKYGITINAVMPGNIVTEGLDGLGEDYLKTMAASIPLKRLGRVEDIGNAALFLASKEAGYITGQTIVVDGGQTVPESLEALEQA